MNVSKDVGSDVGLKLRHLSNGYLGVEDVIPGGAAQRSSDIKKGDVIMTVDGKDVRGLQPDEVKNKINGSSGNVQLGVFRYTTLSRGPAGTGPSAGASGSGPMRSSAPIAPRAAPAAMKSTFGSSAPSAAETHSAKGAHNSKPPPGYVRDPQGEARVGQLAQQARQSGRKYEDPEFPAAPTSLIPHGNKLGADTAQGLEGTDVREIIWQRPIEIPPEGVPGEVFVEGTDPDDIVQGELGTCYFLAAIAACASEDALIEDLIVEDHADVGIYGVKYYYTGSWHTIVVDDRIPCKRDTRLPWSSSWNTASPKETWVMLAEKAWAKIHRSYTNCDGGFPADTLVYLTGGWKKTHTWEPAQFNQEQAKMNEIWADCAHALDDHKNSLVFMSACISMSKAVGMQGMDHATAQRELGLGGDHAYSILRMKEHNGLRLVKVRNPWGRVEWSGAWHDNDPQWTPQLRELMQMPAGAVDDGTYCLDWATFCSFYCTIGYVRVFHGTYNHEVVRGTFGADVEGQGSPSVTTATLTNSTEKVYLQVEQADTRKLKFDGDYELRAQLIVVNDAQGQEVASSEFYQDRTVGLEADLPPNRGPFTVQIFSQPMGKCGDSNNYWLSAWSLGNLSLNDPNDPSARIPQTKEPLGVVVPPSDNPQQHQGQQQQHQGQQQQQHHQQPPQQQQQQQQQPHQYFNPGDDGRYDMGDFKRDAGNFFSGAGGWFN